MKTVHRRAVSLRLVISLIIICVSVIPAVAVSEVLINSAINREIETSSSEIQGQVLILANQLQNDSYMSRSASSDMTAAMQQMADVWGSRIQIITTAGRIIFDSYNADTGKYNISEMALAALEGQTISDYNSDTGIYAVVMPIHGPAGAEDMSEEGQGTGTEIAGAIMVNMDMGLTVAGLEKLRAESVQLWMAVLCLALIVVVLTLVYAFKPFRTMVSQMQHAADDAVNKVDVPAYAETVRLSEAVNKTLQKARDLDLSRREFVSNVSHELKTPITSIRVLADSLNSMEDAPLEMYKEFMQDISRELERESNTIDDLLSMVRLEEGAVPLNISEVDMNSWLEDMLRGLNPLAKNAGITLLMESIRPVIANFDELKMYRAISNLIINGVKYNKPEGWVKVTLDADYHYFILKVSDDGIGIPGDAQAHIFERFYRVDKARSRESGGTGLGLSITKKIINMHHGTIRLESEPGSGSVFTVKVPLEYRLQPDEGGEDDNEESSD